MPGVEPGAFHMQSERATTALHPLRLRILQPVEVGFLKHKEGGKGPLRKKDEVHPSQPRALLREAFVAQGIMVSGGQIDPNRAW